jgi:hypothetical protein
MPRFTHPPIFKHVVGCCAFFRHPLSSLRLYSDPDVLKTKSYYFSVDFFLFLMVVFFNISAYDASQCDYGPILASMAKVSSELLTTLSTQGHACYKYKPHCALSDSPPEIFITSLHPPPPHHHHQPVPRTIANYANPCRATSGR